MSLLASVVVECWEYDDAQDDNDDEDDQNNGQWVR